MFQIVTNMVIELDKAKKVAFSLVARHKSNIFSCKPFIFFLGPAMEVEQTVWFSYSFSFCLFFFTVPIELEVLDLHMDFNWLLTTLEMKKER